jgi:hypothetical protein
MDTDEAIFVKPSSGTLLDLAIALLPGSKHIVEQI